jgi:hypothetical protein
MIKSELGIPILDFSVEQKKHFIDQSNFESIKSFTGPSDPDVQVLVPSENTQSSDFLSQFNESNTLLDLDQVTESKLLVLSNISFF